MNRVFLSTLLVLLLSSCEFVEGLINGDVVARVEGNVLYHKDIDGLVPKGTSPEDSVAIVRKYINTWATNKILLSNAESRLSREDRDIEQALEEYKTSLLVYRYEKLYVEKNLDTLISEQECRDYYEKHMETYVAPCSIVKARYIRINSASPNAQIIRNKYRSLKMEDLDLVAEMSMSSADKYTDFNMDWVPLSHIAKEMGGELSVCEKELANKSYMELEKGNFISLLRVYEKVNPGEITPYDYNINFIKESILSKRKQDLIANLERNLLEDALNNNKLVIYSNDND